MFVYLSIKYMDGIEYGLATIDDCVEARVAADEDFRSFLYELKSQGYSDRVMKYVEKWLTTEQWKEITT